MRILRPIFYDQLSHCLASLKNLQKQDIVFMFEVMEAATYIQHHPKKIALWFATMRHFAAELAEKGIQVRYIKLTDQANTQKISTEFERALNEIKPDKIVLTEPSEYYLRKMVDKWQRTCGIPLEIKVDDRFLCSISEFKQWAQDRKQLRLEYFYRQLRKKYNLLMEADGKPVGGVWNCDSENRKSAPPGMQFIKRIRHKKSRILIEVLSLVSSNFSDHFGDLEPFYYALTRKQALRELDHFIKFILPKFGDYQDAMLKNEPYLNHSLLSSYLNLGLLTPFEICKKAELAYFNAQAPLNSVEGFIRQILGWREFVRGIYWLKMPEYAQLNYLAANNPLPSFYWGAPTKLACINEAVLHTKMHAYSHHIQRLMVTGNFALLAGIDVKQIQAWYLAVYSDAYEWVEMPNTLGMALFGDGGILASKPYAASGQYINKMSNFCKECYYNVKALTGAQACPFNALYWNFLYQHRNKLEKNPRLAFMYQTWDRFDEQKKHAIRAQAAEHLQKLHKGEL